MKKISNVENMDNGMLNTVSSLSFRKTLLAGLVAFVMSSVTLSGCSKDNMVSDPVVEVVDESVPTFVPTEVVTYNNEYGTDIQKPYSNKVHEDDIWNYVILYEREVRRYTDGSVGYSNWECKGPYLIRYLPDIDVQLEYKYDFIGTVELRNDVCSSLGLDMINLSVLGEPMLALNTVKVYEYFTRDYIDGKFTDWVSSGDYYIDDKELKSGELVKFQEVDKSIKFDFEEEDYSLKLK